MKKENALSVIALAALVFLILFGGVSESDIAKCVEATSYSADRCANELMR